MDTGDWEKSSTKGIPQQTNSNDCGVFMCLFADYVSRDAPYEFGQADMPAFRRQIVISILDNNLD
jgi:sentrin-specific protease 1